MPTASGVCGLRHPVRLPIDAPRLPEDPSRPSASRIPAGHPTEPERTRGSGKNAKRLPFVGISLLAPHHDESHRHLILDRNRQERWRLNLKSDSARRTALVVIQSNTGWATGMQCGNSVDLPVPADYDGDRKTDIAVFRPSDGTWYIGDLVPEAPRLSNGATARISPFPGIMTAMSNLTWRCFDRPTACGMSSTPQTGAEPGSNGGIAPTFRSLVISMVMEDRISRYSSFQWRLVHTLLRHGDNGELPMGQRQRRADFETTIASAGRYAAVNARRVGPSGDSSAEYPESPATLDGTPTRPVRSRDMAIAWRPMPLVRVPAAFDHPDWISS